MPRLLIAASGTGGHLYPALAVAQTLPPSWKVKWLGVPDRLEKELVPSQYDLITIRAGGLQGSGVYKLIQLVKLIAAIWQVRNVLINQKIDIVFTTGGYIAAPTILAASWCKLPVVMHESNAMPGKVTRLMSRFCNFVALGMPPAKSRLPNCQALVTGTPIRRQFVSKQDLPNWVPHGKGPLLVVMGGSQGALGLNRMVRAIYPSLLKAGCRIVHLTGHQDNETKQISHPNLVELPFSKDIPGLLQNADLAISRAGAGSLCELAICGTPAILVPFPQAADHHQEINASYAAQLGAAIVVHQHPSDHSTLKKSLWRILEPRLNRLEAKDDLLSKMHEGMKKLAVKNATSKVADLLIRLT